MYFDTLSAAVTMDGHGGFVWAAYAICLLVLVFIVVAPVLRQRKTLLRLSGELKRQQLNPDTVNEVR